MDSRLHQAHLRSTNNIRASPALPFRNSPSPSINSTPSINRPQIPPLGPDQKSRRVPDLSRTTNASSFQERFSTQKDSATRQVNADFKSKTMPFSKGTLDVLAKASEILQKSSKITIGSTVVPTTATSINFERAQYERPTPTTVQSQNFSAKTSNALGKADEILKKSLGYTRDSRVSANKGQHLPRESVKSVSESNIHVPLGQPNDKLNNYAAEIKPIVDQEKKMHSIFSRIDQTLQRSLQITGSPKGPTGTIDIPATNFDVRQPRPVQKPLNIGSSHEILNQRSQSTEKNIRGYQEVSRINNEIIRHEKEIQSKNLLSKPVDTELNQGMPLKSSLVMERRLNIESHSPLTENKTGFNENINTKEIAQPQASQAPPRVKKPKFVEEDYEDGTVYKGEKIREVKHGRGEILYPDGSRYEGEWENDRKNGYGVQTFPNGNIEYDGEWKDDSYHGNGVLMNEAAQETRNFNYRDFDSLDNNWTKYEGEFLNGKMHGLGTLTLFNNERHVGKFKNDKVHGVGVFHMQNGEAVSAEWENNKLVRI